MCIYNNIGLYDIIYYKYDDVGTALKNEDGTIKLFRVKVEEIDMVMPDSEDLEEISNDI